MNPTDFRSLPLHRALLDNLVSLSYHAMTPVQAQSLPPMLDGRDVIAQAKTGSGKTAAFGLAVLQGLEPKRFRVQAMVLCPTRELADQVATEIRKLARALKNIKVLTLCGGMPFGPQVGSLEHGVHIVVGTPGRVEKHLGKGTLALSGLTCLVLDEADRMLDMGFEDSIDTILRDVPTQRQTLLFSATFPDEILAMTHRVMSDPVTVQVDSAHDDTSIEQFFFKVDKAVSRSDAVRSLLLQYKPESAVVFCITKRETQEMADALRRHRFGALALHGDLDQKDRDQTMVRFVNKSASVLVATDVAARGLDIDALDAVINAQFPRDFDAHTHRIGRTGRA
ncbi:MAG: ATP-dependent RNA helicase DbpA, partial [Pseudomonadota bacterium]